MSDATEVKRYHVKWNGNRGCYTVDIPNWEGEVVVAAWAFDSLVAQLRETQERLRVAEKDAARYLAAIDTLRDWFAAGLILRAIDTNVPTLQFLDDGKTCHGNLHVTPPPDAAIGDVAGDKP